MNTAGANAPQRPPGSEARLADDAQARHSVSVICNLYSLSNGPAAIRELTGAMTNRVGNMEPLPGIFPDQAAPIVRTAADGSRKLVQARWGMPTPPTFVKGEADYGVTNIRNVASPHWRRWLALSINAGAGDQPLRIRAAARSRHQTVLARRRQRLQDRRRAEQRPRRQFGFRRGRHQW